MHPYSPSIDTLIVRKYSVGNVDQKLQNKTALQRELGWPAETRRAMVALPLGMTEKLGGDLFLDVLPGFLTLPLEFLVLGKGSEKFGAVFTKLAKEQGHRVHIVREEEKEIHMMLAASDIALFLVDPSGTDMLTHCLQYGVVPLAPSGTQGLDDYDPVQEAGNAFLFAQQSSWHVFASMVRAAETYKFPFDWRTIQRHCMESAGKSAKTHAPS